MHYACIEKIAGFVWSLDCCRQRPRGGNTEEGGKRGHRSGVMALPTSRWAGTTGRSIGTVRIGCRPEGHWEKQVPHSVKRAECSIGYAVLSRVLLHQEVLNLRYWRDAVGYQVTLSWNTTQVINRSKPALFLIIFSSWVMLSDPPSRHCAHFMTSVRSTPDYHN
jgi:hypothetical protein